MLHNCNLYAKMLLLYSAEETAGGLKSVAFASMKIRQVGTVLSEVVAAEALQIL